MSLPCCFTDEEVPYCENRRHARSPMCLWHTKETTRRAIWDDSLPRDVLVELAEYADWMGKVRELNHAYEHRLRVQDQYARIVEAKKKEPIPPNFVVYYVRLTGGRIKIGWTGNLEQRLRTYRSTAQDLLAIEPGGQPEEAERHKQFAHLRIGRAEEFREAPALLKHIESLRERAA